MVIMLDNGATYYLLGTQSASMQFWRVTERQLLALKRPSLKEVLDKLKGR
jgi:hypothetical protein